MRLSDIIISSCRKIRKNVLKSILSILEITIVLSIILVLGNYTTTVSKNSSRIIKDYYSENTSTINLELLTYDMDIEYAKSIKDSINKNRDVIEGIYYNAGDFTCIDYTFLDTLPITMAEGQLYNNGAGIYISKSMKEAYEQENSMEIELFNSYSFEFLVSTYDEGYKSVEYSAMVMGIYEDENYGDYIMDYSYPQRLSSHAAFNSMTVVVKASKDNYKSSVNKIFRIYDSLQSRIDDILAQDYDGTLDYNYYCDFKDDYNKVKNYNLIINSVFVIISVLFIIFASLAIVASVNISLEENKEIIRIEKAYGMKQKDFYLINAFEFIYELIISFGLSIIISSILNVAVKNLANKSLKQTLYSFMYSLSYNTTFEFGSYTLLFSVCMFIVFSLLFIYFSLKKKYNSRVIG